MHLSNQGPQKHALIMVEGKAPTLSEGPTFVGFFGGIIECSCSVIWKDCCGFVVVVWRTDLKVLWPNLLEEEQRS